MLLMTENDIEQTAPVDEDEFVCDRCKSHERHSLDGGDICGDCGRLLCYDCRTYVSLTAFCPEDLTRRSSDPAFREKLKRMDRR